MYMYIIEALNIMKVSRVSPLKEIQGSYMAVSKKNVVSVL